MPAAVASTAMAATTSVETATAAARASPTAMESAASVAMKPTATSCKSAARATTSKSASACEAAPIAGKSTACKPTPAAAVKSAAPVIAATTIMSAATVVAAPVVATAVVASTPAPPGADADKHAVYEIVGSPETVRRAGIRIIIVVSVRTDRLRSVFAVIRSDSHANGNLRVSASCCGKQQNPKQSCVT